MAPPTGDALASNESVLTIARRGAPTLRSITWYRHDGCSWGVDCRSSVDTRRPAALGQRLAPRSSFRSPSARSRRLQAVHSLCR